MIISASRRTDIPAFYSEWFFNRIKEGYVLVRNPMNYYQVSKISLRPDVVDCIVFWTKNPKNMIDNLDLLSDYNYYFQFTLNSYDKTIERNIPKKAHIIDTFRTLSQKIGSNRVIWRYDPILLTDKFTKDYHYKYFEYLASKLNGYTDKCVISFLDLYTKTQRNLKNLNIQPIKKEDMKEIAIKLVEIAKKYNLTIETCSEEIDLADIGIKHGKCIDDKLISEILGVNLNIEKDKNQREICGCVSSIDIGAYNTCNHNCLYCYANYSEKTVKKNIEGHNSNSPFIIGDSNENDKIKERKMKSFMKDASTQLSFFD